MNNIVERIFESVARSLHTPVVRVTCVLLVGGGSAFADERASIAVHPSTIRLGTSSRQTRVVATLRDGSGQERDATGSVELSIDDESVAQISEGRVVAVASGETTLRARVEGLTTSAQVRVGNLEKRPRASFRHGALVALTKQGCNSGGCHGAPSGKGGFRLSLFAYDEQLDAETLTREYGQRRVDVFNPDRSLVLRKPLGRIPHGGGVRLRSSDPAHGLLRHWIADGCRLDAPEAADCERIEVFPQQRTLETPHVEQQLLVLAHFSDGGVRDVTDVATYLSSDETRASISATGLVRASASGEIGVLVQYLELAETSRLTFIPEVAGFTWKEQPENNYVDRLVFAKLRQMRISPSGECRDEEFVRRVYIDLLGRLPGLDETLAFLDQNDANKRTKLIDRLLENPGFATFQATHWGDLLRVSKKRLTSAGVHKLHGWIVRAMSSNMPYDDFVREILTAQGSTSENPPANYYRTAATTDDCTETTAQVFLGVRIQCAKCHNHPYERWTQDNYYGLGAFFNRVQRTKLPDDETLVWIAREGEVKQPRTKRTMKPWLPDAGELDLPPDVDRRNVLVDWLGAPDNRYLARVEVNRIWSHIMGRGIVEPIDDFRASNPPSNPALLDALASDFVESGYNRRELIRTIVLSRSYQLESRTNRFNERDTVYFSHARSRLLAAEQILNAISQVTGIAESFEGLPGGTLATELPSPEFGKDFLRVFGKPPRETVCECERSQSSDLARVLELINGDLVAEKIGNESNRIHRLVAAGKSDAEIVTELYLAAYSRRPTAEELAAASGYVAGATVRMEGLEDLVWTILNSKELLFQH